MQDILIFIYHHMVLASALLVAVLLLIIVEMIRMKQGAASLSPARLTHFINHQNAVVVDLRNIEAYHHGHIVGAISIPFQAKEIDVIQKKIDKFKSQPIVLACERGISSRKVAQVLQKNAYQVYVLSGGVDAWKMANMPLIKGK